MSATSDMHYDALSSESEHSPVHDALETATLEASYGMLEQSMPPYEATEMRETADSSRNQALAYQSQVEAQVAARNAEQQAILERKNAVADIAHATQLLISYRDYEIAA